jgi:hypothetical protein
MAPDKLFKLAEVAKEAGVSAVTVRRWLRLKKIREPGRDRNGWRVWAEDEMQEVIDFAGVYEEPVYKKQGALFKDDEQRTGNTR